MLVNFGRDLSVVISLKITILAGETVCSYELLHASLFQTKETHVRQNISEDSPPKKNAFLR
jgi:hypothetical protein